ncbi:MAG: glutamine-hydrolyzing GMP synthase [Kiritimatiellae bacterium]|nr:glutamine-hydrolyzing GMP synthase [Kiritimatiellia bacterium]
MTVPDTILVLDFGSQYNQLIARRIREKGVYSELRPHTMTAEQIRATPGLKGVVLSGSPKSVNAPDFFDCDPAILDIGVPVFGICYGMQLMAKKLGGRVARNPRGKEYGRMPVEQVAPCPLLDGLPARQDVWMSHGDHVEVLPPGFRLAAKSDSGFFAAAFDPDRRLYAVQYHPEVRHSVYGNDIIANFLFRVCGCEKNWTMEGYLESQIRSIRETVGGGRVLCGLSGGVDSTVVAVLLHRAIGDRLTCMFIDHGMLRKDEGEQVMATCKGLFGMDVVRIDARERFLSKLAGVSEPEKKRKIVGAEFVKCFDEESAKLGSFDFLAQGTLYTDVVESGTATAQTIKSHHNVGGLPKDMKFRLVEPLNRLFKDEARALGEALGIPREIVWRQPFPGPGLAIRIMGEVDEEALSIVRESDAVLREEIARAGLEKQVWQYFTVLTNVRSVGVMGDERTYCRAVAVRAVTSIDGMTADWARLPWEVLDAVSRRIVNEVPGVNRVVYDVTAKPPGTIEWE